MSSGYAQQQSSRATSSHVLEGFAVSQTHNILADLAVRILFAI
jgi:hypothetical protein